MIDKSFLLKKIKKITESYIHDEFISISNEELHTLVNLIYKQYEHQPTAQLHEIIHDVVYEWLTT
ncbi:YqzH family protein [Alkalihalobacterium alkalicellulosilyticum]|uniref:YqzH family protein n=1 Tax=Alkalihalobacterium alkalicellulosilyticum TaxID=1912214 RepID=UPI0009981837|nr:YqzH family protein [Bacillus alkalicellulosilyticus]